MEQAARRSTLQCNNQPVIDAFAIMKSLWLFLFRFLSKKKCPPPPPSPSRTLFASLECINSVAINAQRIEYYRANSHGLCTVYQWQQHRARFVFYCIRLRSLFVRCTFSFSFLLHCFTATARGAGARAQLYSFFLRVRQKQHSKKKTKPKKTEKEKDKTKM